MRKERSARMASRSPLWLRSGPGPVSRARISGVARSPAPGRVVIAGGREPGQGTRPLRAAGAGRVASRPRAQRDLRPSQAGARAGAPQRDEAPVRAAGRSAQRVPVMTGCCAARWPGRRRGRRGRWDGIGDLLRGRLGAAPPVDLDIAVLVDDDVGWLAAGLVDGGGDVQAARGLPQLRGEPGRAQRGVDVADPVGPQLRAGIAGGVVRAGPGAGTRAGHGSFPRAGGTGQARGTWPAACAGAAGRGWRSIGYIAGPPGRAIGAP